MQSSEEQHYKPERALRCVVAYNQYGAYCVPESSSHRPAARKILNGDIHEPQTIRYLMSNCAGGDIVHAGAYFGDFLPALSHGCSPEATIWAFEPNVENYRCAKITLLLNGITNVKLINAGLSERRETRVMLIRDENGQAWGGASRILREEESHVGGATEIVQMVTIDGVVPIDRRLSIIQLDVEGFEKEALRGALQTIQRCSPTLVLEVWPGSLWLQDAWFAENILGLGYELTETIHGNAVLVRKSH
jgi:FkbM family methyltransferase